MELPYAWRITAILCTLQLGLSLPLSAQDQDKADSLKIVFEKNTNLPPASKMKILARIAAHSSTPDEILLYADKLLKEALLNNNNAYIIEAYQSRGVAYRLMGNLKIALKSLFQSAKLAIEHSENKLLIDSYLEIANTYNVNKDYKNALTYNRKAIEVIRSHDNEDKLAITLLNTGYTYYTLNELDAALSLYNEAEPIFKNIDLPVGTAYVTGNRALIYWKKGNHTTAEHELEKAIALLEPLGDHFGISDFQNHLGRIYAEQNHTDLAISHALDAVAMAKKHNLKEQVRDASLLLSELYEIKKLYKDAFDYQSLYIIYRDSIENQENTRQLANLRTEFEVNLKEKEIAILEKDQLLNRIYIATVIFLLIFAALFLLYLRQRLVYTRLMASNERKDHTEKINNLLTTQETKALQSMVKGQEKERKRLSGELHNHFGSLLATIKVNINAIDESAIANHHTLTTLINQACSDIRSLSHSLNIGISEDFGLIPALRELVANLSQVKEMEIEFTASMCLEKIGFENEIIIYRIVQELVSNALKHAEATKLSIQLTCFEEENLVNIIVHDNGKGFDQKITQPGSSGMGIKSLVEMIAAQQGEIIIDSNPSSGTTVNIDFPIAPVFLNL